MSNVVHKIAKPIFAAAISPVLGRPKLVCILGVMRSGSTLLTELLLNNPHIVGFGESHISYRDKTAIGQLRYWSLYHRRRLDFGEAYLLDKILHHAHAPDPAPILGAADLWPIFLVRSPDANGASLRRMFDVQGRQSQYTDVAALLLDRYRQLTSFLEKLDCQTPVAAISYEALTERPCAALASITQFLNLSTPLTARYAKSRVSGKWGVGDGGENIRTGEILPSTARKTQTSAFRAPDEVHEHYDQFVAQLRRRANAHVI